jgi:hypothetical protein
MRWTGSFWIRYIDVQNRAVTQVLPCISPSESLCSDLRRPHTLSPPHFQMRGRWYLEPDDPELLRLLAERLEIVAQQQVREDHLQLVGYEEAARAGSC